MYLKTNGNMVNVWWDKTQTHFAMSAFSDKTQKKIEKMSTNTFSIVFFFGQEKIVCPKKKTKHKHTNHFIFAFS